MYDFENGAHLLRKCEKYGVPISEIMKRRDLEFGGLSEEMIRTKLDKVFEIMDHSIHDPIEDPHDSMGGLIGGEARMVWYHKLKGNTLSGSFLSKAIAYSMAVLETNASMGLIVAAPTAGSSGVVPGCLIAGMEERGFTKEQFDKGILNAGAIGYILMRNSSVSGAEAGCQAEVGAASAMAASALVEIMGGSPEVCFNAASLALSNLLGLVCDPIAGLVEAPCQSRNSIGAANAIVCADLALSGVKHQIPFDEMSKAMYRVGRSLPFELRETAMGGCAATPTGCALRDQCVVGEQIGERLEPLSKV